MHAVVVLSVMHALQTVLGTLTDLNFAYSWTLIVLFVTVLLYLSQSALLH